MPPRRRKPARGWTTNTLIGDLVVVRSPDGLYRPYTAAETIYRDMFAVLRVADADGREHDMTEVTGHYYQWVASADLIDARIAVQLGPWKYLEHARERIRKLRKEDCNS